METEGEKQSKGMGEWEELRNKEKAIERFR